MAKQADLDSLARLLAEVGRRLLTAKAANVDEVNGIFRDLGGMLIRAAHAIGSHEDQTEAVWNVTEVIGPTKKKRGVRR